MSEVQNINDKPYRDYVRIYCDDDRKDELIQALDIIWEHPEGRKKIGESYENRGTLEIIYDAEQNGASYGMPKSLPTAIEFVKQTGNPPPLGHRISLSSDENNYVYIQQDINQQEYKVSLISLLAHELYHASDKHFTAPKGVSFHNNDKYNKLLLDLSKTENKLNIISDFIPENYSELDKQQKKNILEDIYENTDCAGLLAKNDKQYDEDRRAVYTDNIKILTYVQVNETPAIDFSNEIVAFANTKRDYQEPQRIRDYSDSVNLTENYKIDKKIFISDV